MLEIEKMGSEKLKTFSETTRKDTKLEYNPQYNQSRKCLRGNWPNQDLGISGNTGTIPK